MRNQTSLKSLSHSLTWYNATAALWIAPPFRAGNDLSPAPAPRTIHGRASLPKPTCHQSTATEILLVVSAHADWWSRIHGGVQVSNGTAEWERCTGASLFSPVLQHSKLPFYLPIIVRLQIVKCSGSGSTHDSFTNSGSIIQFRNKFRIHHTTQEQIQDPSYSSVTNSGSITRRSSRCTFTVKHGYWIAVAVLQTCRIKTGQL
jgi:hypothetical protein